MAYNTVVWHHFLKTRHLGKVTAKRFYVSGRPIYTSDAGMWLTLLPFHRQSCLDHRHKYDELFTSVLKQHTETIYLTKAITVHHGIHLKAVTTTVELLYSRHNWESIFCPL